REISCKICEKMLHTLFKAESSSDSLVFSNSTYQRLSAFFFPQALSTADLIWTKMMWYLKSAFDAYQKVQSSVQSRLSEVRSAALSPLHMTKNLMKGSSKANPNDASEELQELRKHISELEGRLQEPKRWKARGRTPAR